MYVSSALGAFTKRLSWMDTFTAKPPWLSVFTGIETGSAIRNAICAPMVDKGTVTWLSEIAGRSAADRVGIGALAKLTAGSMVEQAGMANMANMAQVAATSVLPAALTHQQLFDRFVQPWATEMAAGWTALAEQVLAPGRSLTAIQQAVGLSPSLAAFQQVATRIDVELKRIGPLEAADWDGLLTAREGLVEAFEEVNHEQSMVDVGREVFADRGWSLTFDRAVQLAIAAATFSMLVAYLLDMHLRGQQAEQLEEIFNALLRYVVTCQQWLDGGTDLGG